MPIAHKLTRLLVQAYKLFGLLALGLIILGIVLFMTTAGFYAMTDTWCNPLLLSESHDQVVKNATLALSEEQALRSLTTELQEKIASKEEATVRYHRSLSIVKDFSGYKQVDARLATDNARAFIAGYQSMNKKRELAIAKIQRKIEEQSDRVQRLTKGPLFDARQQDIPVVFIAHNNRENAQPGTFIYGCQYWFVACSKVGQVSTQIAGETYSGHPRAGSKLRGHLYQVILDDPEAIKLDVLFLRKKPFFIL